MTFQLSMCPLRFYMTLNFYRNFSHSMGDPLASTHFTFSHFWNLHNYITHVMWQNTLAHMTFVVTLLEAMTWQQ